MVALNAQTYYLTWKRADESCLEKRLTNAEDKRAKIKKLVTEGKSLDEIKQALARRIHHRGPGLHGSTFTENSTKN